MTTSNSASPGRDDPPDTGADDSNRIATGVECDPKTAWKYLSWFADLGIVSTHDDHPAMYECNDTYFDWRRIDQLTAEHSVEALQERVCELTARIATYEETI